jgi:hypothetical protein
MQKQMHIGNANFTLSGCIIQSELTFLKTHIELSLVHGVQHTN